MHHNNIVAILKYARTPKISMAVVTKGPVETAGSNLSLYKIIGMIDATVHAINIDEKIDRQTVSPRSKGEVLIDKFSMFNFVNSVIIVPKSPRSIP